MHGPLDRPNKANQGFMNNPGIIVTEQGMIMVDPGSTYQVGKQVLAEARKISKQPIVAVFNSHIHGDHWLGNQAIVEAYPQVKIYGHAQMIKMANGNDGLQWIDIMNELTEGQAKDTKVVAPSLAVKHSDELKIAGQTFRIHAFKKSHTNTDIMVEHVDSKTMFMGDNSFNKRMGRFDRTSSIHGTIEALQYVAKLDIKAFVPGHGQTGNYDEAVKTFLGYLLLLRNIVAKGFEQGLENYEIKPIVLQQMGEYKKWSGFDHDIGRHVSKMYLEVEAREL